MPQINSSTRRAKPSRLSMGKSTFSVEFLGGDPNEVGNDEVLYEMELPAVPRVGDSFWVPGDDIERIVTKVQWFYDAENTSATVYGTPVPATDWE